MQSFCLHSAIHVSSSIAWIADTLIRPRRFEFYVGMVRRKFEAVSDNLCFAATSSDSLSPFSYASASTRCQVVDTQHALGSSGFLPGQRILTITTPSAGVGCYETWINGTHFFEQGNQKSDSATFQATLPCPLCHNCATSSACQGRCSINGTLACSDPRMHIFLINLLVAFRMNGTL